MLSSPSATKGTKVNKTINLVSKLVKKILNNIVKTLFPLLLGVAILFWIYRDFDFHELIDSLKGMNWWWFALSVVFGVVSHVIRGVRWRLTLAPLGYYPRRDTCIYSIFIAYGANLIVPRVGEVSRCVVLERYEKVPFVQSLGTVVSERLVDTLMVALITVVAVSLQWQVFYSFLAESGGNATTSDTGCGRTVVILISVVAFFILLLLLLRKMSVWAKLKSFISRFWEGATSLVRMKNFGLFAFDTFAIWFCYFMQFYLCFFCFTFSSELSLLAALLLFMAGSISVVVPTPNGAGPWHFAVMSIMMLYGVAESDAQIFALIVHTSQTLLVALLGVIGWLMLQFKKNNV